MESGGWYATLQGGGDQGWLVVAGLAQKVWIGGGHPIWKIIICDFSWDIGISFGITTWLVLADESLPIWQQHEKDQYGNRKSQCRIKLASDVAYLANISTGQRRNHKEKFIKKQLKEKKREIKEEMHILNQMME